MSKYKLIPNPITGQLQLVLDDTSLHQINFKEGVDTFEDLPIENNDIYDSRIVNENHNLYIWDGEQWQNQGDVIDISWESIRNKPSNFTPIEHNNEYHDLDFINLKGFIDASTEPDYPESSKGDLYIISNSGKIGGASGPSVRVGMTILCKSNSGSGSHSAVGEKFAINGGDMSRLEYDTDSKGIVDEAQAINTGEAGETASGASIVDAVDKKHDQNTDTKLDEGGANEVTAEEANNAYDHSQLDSGNPHNVKADEVDTNEVGVSVQDSLDGKPDDEDVEDAITKAHDQNTDTGTDNNIFSIGDGANTEDKEIIADNGNTNKPKIRYNKNVGEWQYTHDGITWYEMGLAEGAGDMLKSIYDTNDSGVVDAAESLEDSEGNNISTAEEVKNTVDDSHNHTSSLSDIDDAVAKKHSQNTDTGTSENKFSIGDGLNSNKEIEANIDSTHKPGIRYNEALNIWQMRKEGETEDWENIESGEGMGNMNTSTYDTNENGIVDYSEALKDSDGLNETSASEVKGAVDDSHTHTNKNTLDNIEEAFTNALKSNYDDAAVKAHDQNSDNKLAEGTADEVTAADASDAVAKKHNQNTDTHTSENDFGIGDGDNSSHKYLTARNGNINEPKIRYNYATTSWQYSNNGIDWYEFGVTADPEAEEVVDIIEVSTDITIDNTHLVKMIEVDSESAVTITLPLHNTEDLPVGFTCSIVRKGTGEVIIEGEVEDASAPDEVILLSSNGNRLFDQYSGCTLTKRAFNEWYIHGDMKE